MVLMCLVSLLFPTLRSFIHQARLKASLLVCARLWLFFIYIRYGQYRLQVVMYFAPSTAKKELLGGVLDVGRWHGVVVVARRVGGCLSRFADLASFFGGSSELRSRVAFFHEPLFSD